jgi:membrane-bound inhibitor of C-type lysozyme
MKVLSVVAAVLAACVISPAALADTPPATNAPAPPAAPAGMQPPMNDFDSAFYNCADGWAFQMSYDSETPTSATMTTNANGKTYTLKRSADTSGGGVTFADGPTKFWTDGRSVRVEGTAQPMRDCHLKRT